MQAKEFTISKIAKQLINFFDVVDSVLSGRLRFFSKSSIAPMTDNKKKILRDE